MKPPVAGGIPPALQEGLIQQPTLLARLLEASGGIIGIDTNTRSFVWQSGTADWWIDNFKIEIEREIATIFDIGQLPNLHSSFTLKLKLVTHHEPVEVEVYQLKGLLLFIFNTSPMHLLHFGHTSEPLPGELLMVGEFHEHSTELVCIASEDGYLKLVNAAWTKLLGWTKEELTSQPWYEFVHPNDLQATSEAAKRLLEDKRLTSFENRYKTKNGDYKWLGWTAYFFPERLLVYAVARDISLQKETETRLQRSDRIVQFATDLLCIAGFDGYLKVVNPAWTEVLGWSEAELLSQPWSVLLHPDDLANTLEKKDLNKQEATVATYENRFRCKDGSYKWLSWNSHPFVEEGIMYSVARDITAAKEAELKVAQTQLLLQKLSKQVPGVVYQYLLRPDGSSCFPYASDGIEAIYGVMPEEVQEDAAKVFDRLHPEDLERVKNEILQSAADLSLFHSRFRVQFPDGSISWRKCDARPERLTDGSVLWHGIITDISREVALHQLVRVSEQKLGHMHHLLKYIIEHASDAVVVFDLQMRYLFVSERFKQEYKLVGRNVEGLSHFDLFPELPSHIREAHQLANLGQLVEKEEDSYLHPDGTITYTKWTCRPFYDESGFVGGHILYLDIITERKEAELALKRTNNYLAGLINHANAPIITWDSKFRITRFNHAFEYFSGYQAEEVIGKPLSVLFLSEALNDSLSKVKAASAGNSWESVEIQIRCKNGESRIALWNSANIYAEDGETLIETIAQGQDITERVKAQRDLQAAFDKMQLLQSALDQVPVYVFMKDIERKYFYANDKTLHFFGESAQSVIGQTDQKYFLPEVAKILSDIDCRVLQGEHTIEQFDTKAASGEIRTYLEAKTPITDPRQNGKIIGLLGCTTDITETVQNLRRIEVLLKGEEAQNERLRNFTHIVSHNLRSHIANMMGIMSLIDMEDPALAASTYIETLRASANHLNETIRNLNEVLDINLSQAHEMQVIDLGKTVKQTIHSVGQLAANAGIRIQNEVVESVHIMGFPAYVDSLVLNMLTNAIKFRDTNKKSEVVISVTSTTQEVCVSFSDNGLGIDLPRYGAKLFGMYKTFHGHPDSKGLGLFITKNQVEAMGGRIEVESEVGVGTTFKVFLQMAAS
jgi:PAS domain S-box-containing protein